MQKGLSERELASRAALSSQERACRHRKIRPARARCHRPLRLVCYLRKSTCALRRAGACPPGLRSVHSAARKRVDPRGRPARSRTSSSDSIEQHPLLGTGCTAGRRSPVERSEINCVSLGGSCPAQPRPPTRSAALTGDDGLVLHGVDHRRLRLLRGVHGRPASPARSPAPHGHPRPRGAR